MLTHMDEKLLKRDVCHEACNQSLKDRMLTCVGEKPHSSDRCCKHFPEHGSHAKQ